MSVTGLYDGYGIDEGMVNPKLSLLFFFFLSLVLSIFSYAALQGALHQSLRHYVQNDQIFILLLFRFIP